MTEKRYQVFVSSTYLDLTEERAEVMQALLELDCMPAGMELFPAANEEQWNWIKKVIDESDYYIVIIGGRYGTISSATGMSYTEMEYRYASDIGKPIIGFIHKSPSKIEAGKSETSPQARKKLEQFRDLVRSKLCKEWTTSADLGAKVSRSITQIIKHHPAAGWIRADQIPNDQRKEVLELKAENDSLKETLRQVGLQDPVGIENLSQGSDELAIEYYYEVKKPKTGKSGGTYWVKDHDSEGTLITTWDELFAHLSPALITLGSSWWVTSTINSFISSKTSGELAKKHPGKKIEGTKIYSNSLDQIKIQLRALKLISVDTEGWALTPYGDNYMTKLLALNK
jgi:hypothetical protein